MGSSWGLWLGSLISWFHASKDCMCTAATQRQNFPWTCELSPHAVTTSLHDQGNNPCPPSSLTKFTVLAPSWFLFYFICFTQPACGAGLSDEQATFGSNVNWRCFHSLNHNTVLFLTVYNIIHIGLGIPIVSKCQVIWQYRIHYVWKGKLVSGQHSVSKILLTYRLWYFWSSLKQIKSWDSLAGLFELREHENNGTCVTWAIQVRFER